jgi:hypothetical protein
MTTAFDSSGFIPAEFGFGVRLASWTPGEYSACQFFSDTWSRLVDDQCLM